MKAVELVAGISIMGILSMIVMQLDLVTDTLAAENVNAGDFQIAIFILVTLLLVVFYSISRS